jgi:(p)ppGpp synthase/HD superfamily hydrolase
LRNQVHRLWAPVEGRFKDYIRHKKDNGYQSLVLTPFLPHASAASN